MNKNQMSQHSQEQLQEWFYHWKREQSRLTPWNGFIKPLFDDKGLVYCPDVLREGAGLLIIKCHSYLQNTLVLDGIPNAYLFGLSNDLELKSRTRCHSPNTRFTVLSNYPVLLLLPAFEKDMEVALC